jgi:predicted AAA+ superfamily ATPase
MLKRKMYDELVSWKKNKTRQSLLITGARQVGKTTIVREFAKENYEFFAELNFYENRTAITTVNAATSSSDLFFRITALTDVQLVPGKSLVFLDEIQECEDMITWAKFLEGQGIDYIFSGSLLGIDAYNIRSIPVGYLTTKEMYPLDYEEFCWACGVGDDVFDRIRECFDSRAPIPDFIHQKMIELFYRYLLVGGMPDAVSEYVNTNDLTAVRSVQQSIYDLYLRDITKYMDSRFGARHVKTIYEAIPGQLSQENRRFVFSELNEQLRFAHLQTAFDWLEHAGVVLPVNRISEPKYPIGLAEVPGAFKLYMNDTGLLTSRLMGSVALDIINRSSSINFGYVFENAVAQELKSQGFELFYYNTNRHGEIDFVTQDALGEVTLCEVKSGKDSRSHAALNNVLGIKNYSFKNVFVLHDGNVLIEGKLCYLPIYMVSLMRP